VLLTLTESPTEKIHKLARRWECRCRFGFLLRLVDINGCAFDIGKCNLDGDSDGEMVDLGPSLRVRLPLGAQLLPVNGSEFDMVACDLNGDADEKWLIWARRWETCCGPELRFHLSTVSQSSLAILTKMEMLKRHVGSGRIASPEAAWNHTLTCRQSRTRRLCLLTLMETPT